MKIIKKLLKKIELTNSEINKLTLILTTISTVISILALIVAVSR